MFKKLTDIFSIAKKAARAIFGKVNPWYSKPNITPDFKKSKNTLQRPTKAETKKPKIITESQKIPDIASSPTKKITPPPQTEATSDVSDIVSSISEALESEYQKLLKDVIYERELEKVEAEAKEEQLAKEVIDNLIDIVRSMDEEGYTPSSPHAWSISPEKAPNSGGAGRMKEESGNVIIDTIRQAVADTDAITVARSLEQYWDGILYHIERLEYAIYDAEYRRRGGGRAAYEAGLLKLKGMLTIGSDDPVQGKNVNG